MKNKQDLIYSCLLGVKKDIGEIKGHLKGINGNIIRNSTDINTNKLDLRSQDKRLDSLDVKFAKIGGGLAVIIVVIQVIFKFFI